MTDRSQLFWEHELTTTTEPQPLGMDLGRIRARGA